jgi:hypothetical protein
LSRNSATLCDLQDHCREVRGETSFDKRLLRLARFSGMRVGSMLSRW